LGFKKGCVFAELANSEDLSLRHLPMNDRTRYNLSFTAASLRPELARVVAELFLETSDWSLTRERVLASNALQSRSVGSAKRMEQERRLRLATLTREQLVLLSNSPAEDRAAVAWLAALKHISFAFEFTAEILRDKLASHDPILRNSDYESFVENRATSHPELALLASSSRDKIRQVLLRMLTEASLLRPGTALGTIQRPVCRPPSARP